MRRVWLGGGVSALVAGVIAAILSAGTPTCSSEATPATFATELASTTTGVLCLAAGNYGEMPNAEKDSPGVTVTAAPGVSRDAVIFNNMEFKSIAQPTAWLTIQKVTVKRLLVTGPTREVTWRNVRFTGQATFSAGSQLGGGDFNNQCGNCPAMDGNNLLVTDSDFDMSECPTEDNGDPCLQLSEARLGILSGTTAEAGAGIDINGNRFHDNCSDGINIIQTNSGNGLQIRNNSFVDLNAPGGCTIHVDAIQLGSPNVTFEGNYFRDVATGIVNYDAQVANTTIRNNVFVNVHPAGAGAIAVCASTDLLVEFNTLIESNFTNCVNHDDTPSVDTIARNNVLSEAPTQQGASNFAVLDYNLCSSGTCAGAHSVNASPAFVGGLAPDKYLGFALAAGSPGHNAASDGTDMGVRP